MFSLLIFQCKTPFTEILYGPENLYYVKKQFVDQESDRNPIAVPDGGIKLTLLKERRCINLLRVEFDGANYADGRLSGFINIYVEEDKVDTVKMKSKIDWMTFLDSSKYHHFSFDVPVSRTIGNISMHIDPGDYGLSIRDLTVMNSDVERDRLLYFFIKRIFC